MYEIFTLRYFTKTCVINYLSAVLV
uniref:Uncharacterized protein n=1 Tax=Anguilla anguilla TaxID=7936 RepID=A0A0E9PB22_ANGAN